MSTINHKEISISMTQKYDLPLFVKTIEFQGKYIILAPDFGQWIILENELQRDMFFLLKSGHTIGDVRHQAKSQKDWQYLIEEIEGRHFFRVDEIEPERNFSLRIYLTKQCNMRCPHCFVYAGIAMENELTFSEISTLIKESVANGCNKIILTGGEPSTHPQFLDILREISKYQVYVQVLTNGTNWNEDLITKSAPLIDEVQVSIDGFDEDSNAQIRGKGNFSKALNSIETFFRHNIFVALSITPTPELLFKNKDRYISFAKKLLDKYGQNRFEIIFAREFFIGREFNLDSVTSLRYMQVSDEVQNAVYDDNKILVFVRKHRYGNVTTNCGFGNLTINSIGDVYYCGRIETAVSHGNIRFDSYEKIFADRALARMATSVQNIFPCCECDLRFICGGGSRLTCFSGLSNIKKIDLQSIKTVSRECSPEHKEEILRLMIESDSLLCF